MRICAKLQSLLYEVILSVIFNISSSELLTVILKWFRLITYYQLVARMMTTNLNSVNKTSTFVSLIIFSYSVIIYAFEPLFRACQQSFFLQQDSQLLHCHLVCAVRRLLVKFSLIFSRVVRFRSLTLFSLQNLQ
jgi:hypothetical protein